MKFRSVIALLCVALLPAAAFAATKNVRVLALILQFQGKSNYATPAGVEKALFTGADSTAAVYRDASGGRLVMTGKAVGPYTIPFKAGGTCDYGNWGSAGLAEATRAGIDVNAFTHHTFIIAGNCSWNGYGYVAGTRTWMKQGAAGFFTHEFGHNLGFQHSGSGPGSAYGDGADPMGGIGNQMVDGPNRFNMGWLTDGALVSTSASREFSIAPLKQGSTAPQLIQLKKPDGGWLYVSMRQAIGRDAKINAAWRDVLIVRSTAKRSTGVVFDALTVRARLKEGEIYTDAANGIRITALGIREGAADMKVEQTGAKCSLATPLVTLAPATVAAGPGQTVEFDVAVTSRSGAACLSADIKVATTGTPAGLTAIVATPTVHVASGGTVHTTLRVMIPYDRQPGTSTVGVKAWTGTPGTGTAKIVIVPAEVQPPTPVPPVVIPPPVVVPPVPPPPVVTLPGSSSAATIPAAADTYISTYHRAISFGTQKSMKDKGKDYPIMVRFAVFASQGGPVPDTATIESAKVFIYKTSSYNHTYGLHRILADWKETATWNNAPTFNPVADATASAPWEPSWLAFDVTSYLRVAPYGWRMVGITGYSNQQIKTFGSREGNPAQAPRLEVVYR